MIVEKFLKKNMDGVLNVFYLKIENVIKTKEFLGGLINALFSRDK